MEKHFVQRYQDGEITIEEFQRLNAIQVIETEGYKILSPEALEYLKGILAAAAPLPPFEKKLAEFTAGMEAQREEIAKAFLAQYQCDPGDVEQYSGPSPEGGILWGLRLKRKKTQAGKVLRPTMGIGRAATILDEISVRIGKMVLGEDAGPIGRVQSLVTEFHDRWFAFHEQTLQAIEEALPDSVEELGGSLPAAIATLAKRMDLAERDANKYQDELARQADEKSERWANYQAGGTYGHVGDISQIISDVDLYQEKLDALAKEWSGKVHQDLTQEILLYADLLRAVCANLEPLRTTNPDGTIPRGDATLIGKINEVVQQWNGGGISRGNAQAAESMLKIMDLINQFGADILAQARAQDKTGPGPEGNVSSPGERSPGPFFSEDPYLLVRDILIRIIYSGHPREEMTAEGKPDWSEIIARINDFLHPKTGIGISQINNLRDTIRVLRDQWAPVTDLCQSNGDLLDMRAGGSIPDRVLQIVEGYIERLQSAPACKDCGTIMVAALVWVCPRCERKKKPAEENSQAGDEEKTTILEICGLPSHEHWLVDGHDFQANATNPTVCGWVKK